MPTDHPRRVRRLRVRPLRPSLPDRAVAAARARGRAPVGLQELPAEAGAPACGARRGSGGVRGGARRRSELLGHARSAVRKPGGAEDAHLLAYAASLGVDERVLADDLAVRRHGHACPQGLPQRRPERRQRHAHVLRERAALRRQLDRSRVIHRGPAVALRAFRRGRLRSAG